MWEELVWPTLKVFPERNVAQAVRRVVGGSTELICLSEVAKFLEAEEQAGYHQRAAYLCSFACLSFSSCFRAQSPCQCTNDNALFFFFLMITWSCCLKWRQDIWISEVALYFLSRTEVLNTQDVTACIQKKPLFWECFSVFCYPNSPLG